VECFARRRFRDATTNRGSSNRLDDPPRTCDTRSHKQVSARTSHRFGHRRKAIIETAHQLHEHRVRGSRPAPTALLAWCSGSRSIFASGLSAEPTQRSSRAKRPVLHMRWGQETQRETASTAAGPPTETCLTCLATNRRRRPSRHRLGATPRRVCLPVATAGTYRC